MKRRYLHGILKLNEYSYLTLIVLVNYCFAFFYGTVSILVALQIERSGSVS